MRNEAAHFYPFDVTAECALARNYGAARRPQSAVLLCEILALTMVIVKLSLYKRMLKKQVGDNTPPHLDSDTDCSSYLLAWD